MKIYASIALVLALGLLAGTSTPSGDADLLPPGVINFRDATVPTVLDVYKLLVKKALITDSQVKKMGTRITLKNERPLSEKQAAMLIEHALLEQAAIVITPLGENRASVTYNDALPVFSNSARAATITNTTPSTGGSALDMQHFRIDTNSFFSNLRKRMKAGHEPLDVNLLKDYFKQQGIDVSPPFATLYRPETGDLLITQRQEDWEKMQRLMVELQPSK